MNLTIGYLYGDLMNIYGDTGNIICLKKRAEWRGIKVIIKPISVGQVLKKGDADIYFFGGGQDLSQIQVSKDLVKNKKPLIKEVERGVPLLAICGGYQLIGRYYKPQNGVKLEGLGIFPAYTLAGQKRMIGNIVVSSMFGDLVGFENHSGKTFLEKGGIPLGAVIKGFGNNGEDQTEGCLYKHSIGCYMHGSLLPKNPKLADWFLQKALGVKYGKDLKLKPLDDKLENLTHERAIKKFSK